MTLYDNYIKKIKENVKNAIYAKPDATIAQSQQTNNQQQITTNAQDAAPASRPAHTKQFQYSQPKES